jgi:hypothetical protein
MAATETPNRWSEIADRLQPSGCAFIDGRRVGARDGTLPRSKCAHAPPTNSSDSCSTFDERRLG